MSVYTNDDAPRPVLVAADYDVRRGNDLIEVTSAATAATITLLPAALVPGTSVTIKDGSGVLRTGANSIDVIVRLLILDTDVIHYDLTQLTGSDFTVAAATAAALAAHTAAGSGASRVLTASASAALVVDGVTVNNANVILVKNQTDARENGRYTVTDKGSGITPWILTRTGGTEAPGTKTKATAGTANTNKIFAARGGIDDSFVVTLLSPFESLTVVSDGISWRATSLQPSSVAPISATYITQTPSGGLSNEQALSALASGLLKSTTATGVVSIAAANTDYAVPATLKDGAATVLTVGTLADGSIIRRSSTTLASVTAEATTGQTAGFTAVGTSTVVAAESTFTGGTGSKAYTIGDIVKALKNLGLLAPS